MAKSTAYSAERNKIFPSTKKTHPLAGVGFFRFFKKNEPLRCARIIWQVLGIGCFLICAAFSAAPAQAEELELSPVNWWQYEFNNAYAWCDASPWGSGWTCNASQSWWVLSHWTGDKTPSYPGYNQNPTDMGSGDAIFSSYYTSSAIWANAHAIAEFYIADDLLEEDNHVVSARILVEQTVNYDLPTSKEIAWFFANGNNRANYVIATSGMALTELVAPDTDGIEIIEWQFSDYGLEYLDWQLHNGDTIYLQPLTYYHYTSSTPAGTYPGSDQQYALYHTVRIYYEVGSSTPPEPEPPEQGSLSSYGIEIPEIWTCCYGFCDLSITAPPQLGWWGIGDAIERRLDYTIGTTTYSADYSSSTTAVISVPLGYGFYNIFFEFFADDELVATGTSRIQIIAGQQCLAGGDPQYLGYCAYPCAGIETSTNPLDFDNLNCSLRKFGCWLTVIDPAALQSLAGNWNVFLHRFPLAPITNMVDNLTIAATGTQAIAAGTIGLPVWSATTSSYSAQNIALGSSTTIQSHGWQKWRRFERIAIWWLAAVVISGTIIYLIL